MAADGVLMPLEEGTSAFITMNPGYIGRAELPESLKVLHPLLLATKMLTACLSASNRDKVQCLLPFGASNNAR